MSQDMMNYNRMVEEALRGVVRQALQRTAADGLPGGHHFYIGFRTNDPGVDIPAQLRAQYPDEMTIVLQHQFWSLEVGEDEFSVTLSFNKRPEALHIPFSAVTSFFDPAVEFGLQFKSADAAARDDDAGALAPVPTGPDGAGDVGDADQAGTGKADDNIVTLDKFRRD